VPPKKIGDVGERAHDAEIGPIGVVADDHADQRTVCIDDRPAARAVGYLGMDDENRVAGRGPPNPGKAALDNDRDQRPGDMNAEPQRDDGFADARTGAFGRYRIARCGAVGREQGDIKPPIGGDQTRRATGGA